MAGVSDKAPTAGLELASGGEELGAVEAELRAIKVTAIASAVPIPLPPVEGKMKVKAPKVNKDVGASGTSTLR